ncbi:preprotein translocase subunit SecA [Sessilibacter corallicola]|uniref:preprotein translocase subunit SecA n=1 Tax=Sessilibacter corallicola TaxID=2904075 RepID=UPI001E4CF47B|nr:preprotein translocase subunit SecA [Sessilibacter corallicola]MCE2027096.1 preprotein translocase subunit SecA [Sessilibacter corallicola]
MLGKAFKAVFGTKNDREVKRMRRTVVKINALEEEYVKLSDEGIKEKTEEFKSRFQKGETLDQLLPEAFALVREAGKRAMEMRHFDVQMIGGITLHEGRIAEMRTGEGKTLMATLPVYLNALSGAGVHVVTVNDYLARRDAQWMTPLYNALGMEVGSIYSMQDPDEKKDAYAADITYGTNNEFGFDYLRDNMALSNEDKSQRPLNFAIVDEVDSILIDEARTPLIISGAAQDSSALYRSINQLIPLLKSQEGEIKEDDPESQNITPGHYLVDEKSRSVDLTELGHQEIENLLVSNGLLEEGDSLYSPGNLGLLHHVHAALRAHTLFHKNVHYIVENNQVMLIDEHTGRTMPGRRLSEGLHQALEAKEGLQIQNESQTLASTTFQNYFRIYKKLSGMTGTADTEAVEFHQIYGLDVVVIPTNKPIAREDLNDLVFLSLEEKYDAIVDDVKHCMGKDVPVLVGTASIETSEIMSARLNKAGIKHQVLNAKFHEKEAEIIAQAGRPRAVTIATNMAGRGTDIVLGGNWEAEVAELDNPTDEQIEKIKSEWKERHQQVLDNGGLHIIGTERHESRRIDNQLRGRSGRQGDPGMTRFYLSLEDSLMRIFASDRVRNIMKAMGMEKGEAIEAKMVNNAIEKAQRKVEGRNFDIRKQLLEYDDVANDQRQVIYQQRNELLDADAISDTVNAIRQDVIRDIYQSSVPVQSVEEQWDIPELEQNLENELGLKLPIQSWLEEDKSLHEESLLAKIQEAADQNWKEKCERFGEVIVDVERRVMLQVLDQLWKEHLANMDHLRQGINLRAYAQKNPKQEYKRESFELFQSLLDNVKLEVTKMLARVEPITREQIEEIERRQREMQENMALQMEHAQANSLNEPAPESEEPAAAAPLRRTEPKVGRNDPCPCGSGKKYKHCHGRLS